MKTTAVLVAALVATAVLGGQAGDRDEANLQGIWKVVRFDVPDANLRKTYEETGFVNIRGDKALVLTRDRTREQTLAILLLKLDSRQSPRAVDLRVEYLAPGGPKGLRKGQTIPAIYSLKGETLRVFANLDGKERPKAPPNKAGAGVITLRRQEFE